MQGKKGQDIPDSREHSESKKPSSTADNLDDEIVESDLELDNSNVVQPDSDPPQKVIVGSTELN